jgi:ketosteroid isomerase-like protein
MGSACITEGGNSVRTIATAGAGVLIMLMSIVLGGCAGSGASNHTTDDKALRDLVDRTVAAAMKRDFGEYGKYYAQQRTLALPGAPIAEESGTPKIQLPDGYAIKMVTVKTGFSDAGDLGYALGTYEQTAPDKSGKLKISVGKWMSVFKKQPDGSWGAVADTFNVDPPT